MATPFRDKHGALERTHPFKLELGCGAAKRDASFIGVDLLDTPDVDIVGDVIDVLRTLDDESVDEIFSSHALEHMPNLSLLMSEVERVLTIGGSFHAIVPHFSNPYYYSDPTHVQPFGLYTFSYFADDQVFKRRVPSYGRLFRLQIRRVAMEFRSASEFAIRDRLKRTIGRVVNSNRWLQEFYEENLNGIISCYELKFELVKVR